MNFAIYLDLSLYSLLAFRINAGFAQHQTTAIPPLSIWVVLTPRWGGDCGGFP